MTLNRAVIQSVVQRLAVHLLCALPLCYWLWQMALTIMGQRTTLSTDPGQILADQTGMWALNFLLLSLALTPLHKWFRVRWVTYRRAVGLWAFAYAVLHVLVFYWLILGGNLATFGRELTQRPYIVLGALALLLLIPLVVTSTQAAMRRLKKNWKKLHQLVYLIAVLAAIHALWQLKGDWGWPMVQMMILVGLLGIRVYWWLQRRRTGGRAL
ncbi:ferric reductase-like transmembrane domain-containing protein [Salinispirillum sp. LH 10-3-1]|uniref:Protein-methionine-sulfoxide reductase heme-binding subunit MsrQ n=1 Tax=Salinispirillum sp. LH 10-3-1 TaxID=2952525 RepID=A0AB38YI19_9GAMM